MNEYIAEFIGTFLLILLGCGVNANVSLKDTKGNSSGWVVIAIGWGLGVFTGVAVAGPVSGAHINPAVTIGLALAGMFSWANVVPFIIAQILGAVAGAMVVWIVYKDHFNRTENQVAVLGTFATVPQIRRPLSNMMSELIGTFVLVFVILYIAEPDLDLPGVSEAKIGLGTLGALPVAFLVIAIGMSLGGTTGYAINPARDFGPRLAHTILPIKTKGGSDWSYSWVPVVGPILGASIAAVLYLGHHFIFS